VKIHEFRSAMPIAAVYEHLGETVHVAGLVETVRDHKQVQFLVLRDGTGAAQIVRNKSDRQMLAPPLLTLGSAVEVIGTAVDAPAVKLGGIEIVARELIVRSSAAAPLPVSDDSALEKQFEFRQVSLRDPRQQLTFRVQTTVEQAMRAFWAERGFIEIHSPKLMGTFSESGAEAFEVDYFGRPAFLAQSPQFYKQMAIAGGMERVFEVGPAFRAERSFTSRHETEFTSIDMELAWIGSHHDLMLLEEQLLAHTIAAVSVRHGDEIESLFGVNVWVPALPFPRVTMAEAQRIVRSGGHAPHREDDLDPQAERMLADYVHRELNHEFVFVTDYPASARPFYHRRHRDRPDLTRSFDLLWHGVEVTTGAQREHRFENLQFQAIERGYALEPLKHYLEFFRFGCPPHGGMGVGLARLMMALLQRANVREVTLLSRTPTRLTP
jgi:aspartyl/asparaginyl-tRNA synthetase